jgi:hypothetical protein
MKDAGTKAFLFFFLIILVFIFLAIGVYIVAGGDVEKMFGILGEGKALFIKFMKWNFPKLSNIPSSDSGEL